MEGEAIEVRDNPEAERYEVLSGGKPAGFAAYKLKAGLVAFTHTEIDPAYEGEGLGSELVSFALADARERGLSVLPFCPFVNGYIKKHRELVDLVAEEHRERFGL